MARKQNKPIMVFHSMTIGEIRNIIEKIISERVNQMTTEICDALIKAHGATHIKSNEATYNALWKRVRTHVNISPDAKDSIGVSVINADYDIRCGYGDGRYI